MAFLRSIWKANSKHKKLSEELALQNVNDTDSSSITETPINDVVTFKLKYLGGSVIEKLSGNNSISSEAVKSVLKTMKKKRKKMQRVLVNISKKGISVIDIKGNDVIQVSIYRISNCSTDATHQQIFSFISTDANETMECHVFLCSKRKVAETVTLAVAHAFSTAYEAWRVLPSTREFQKSEYIDSDKKDETFVENHHYVEEKLIDFDEPCNDTIATIPYSPDWVSFGDELE